MNLLCCYVLSILLFVSSCQKYDWTAVDKLVLDYIRIRAFPGAVVAIANQTSILYTKAYGGLTYSHDIHEMPVTFATKYDIASQTKVIGTTISIMNLVYQKSLKLTDLVAKYIPQYAVNNKGNTTIEHLLLHCSGLPYDVPGALPQTRQELFKEIYSIKPLFPVCSNVAYSNLGFITLSEIVRIVSNQTVQKYYQSMLDRMGLKETGFNPPIQQLYRIAPTEYDNQIRMDIVRGTAHQRVAYFLGGVAGHSGFFSTASDILRFSRILLSSGKLPNQTRIFEQQTLKNFTTRVSGLPYYNTRAYGFDTACPGTKIKNCVGHDGSTGMMLWVDTDNKFAFSFATNRGHPNVANNLVDEFKPKLADTISSILGY